jgi:hypothetical protein
VSAKWSGMTRWSERGGRDLAARMSAMGVRGGFGAFYRPEGREGSRCGEV